MFCTQCGNELPENANFCPACGNYISDTKQESEEKVLFDAPDVVITEVVNEEEDRERDDLGGSILKFAIMGLGFTVGSGGMLALVGLILSIVSRSKLNTYIARYRETRGRATVGKHLGVAAMISSIVLTAFWTLYFMLIIAVLASEL